MDERRPPERGSTEQKELSKTERNRFEKAFEKYVSLILKEKSLPPNPLIPPHLQNSKVEIEIRQSLDTEEIGKHIRLALALFDKEGKKLLDEKTFEKAQENFRKTQRHLARLNLAGKLSGNFSQLLGITDETTLALYQVAAEKFKEKAFDEAFSLFVLLSILHPDNSGYWYRLGIVAQNKGDHHQALRAYAVALLLDPLLIEARIFAMECYLKLGERADARMEYEAAKTAVQSKAPTAEEKLLLDYAKQLLM